MLNIRIEKLASLAQSEYEKMRSPSHDWQHIRRVWDNCLILSKDTNANLEILIPASLLHDLGRASETDLDTHSEDTDLAQFLLSQAGYLSQEIGAIVDCIKTHSVGSGKEPSTTEAKLLFDADKLDIYGAVGFARYLALSGEKGWSIDETIGIMFDKVIKVSKIGGFYTERARKIGFGRQKTSYTFFYLLLHERGMSEKVRGMEDLLRKRLGGLLATMYLAIIRLLS